jgi:hypothetical protein
MKIRCKFPTEHGNDIEIDFSKNINKFVYHYNNINNSMEFYIDRPSNDGIHRRDFIGHIELTNNCFRNAFLLKTFIVGNFIVGNFIK